jgi:hypothetical protein
VARARLDPPELGDEQMLACLRHDQQFAVGAVEDPVRHRAVGGVQMDADPDLGLRIPVPAIAH